MAADRRRRACSSLLWRATNTAPPARSVTGPRTQLGVLSNRFDGRPLAGFAAQPAADSVAEVSPRSDGMVLCGQPGRVMLSVEGSAAVTARCGR